MEWTLVVRDSKVYACSDTNLGQVLLHYEVFYDEENRNISTKIYRVSFGEIFLRFAGPLNMFVPFLVPIDEKNLRTKFEIEEENTKLQIARKLPL